MFPEFVSKVGFSALQRQYFSFRKWAIIFFFLFSIPSFSQTNTLKPGYILPNPATSQAGKDQNQYNLGAQDYIVNVQHFGRKQGLSHRDARYTFQDSRGFIWIGTVYGLNRFDGHDFEIFTKEKDSLPFNRVTYIVEDPSGWLWLFRDRLHATKSTDIAIAFINIHTKEVQSFEQRFGVDIPFNPNQIFSVVKDKRGTLYFGSKDKLIIKFHPSEGFKILPIENGRRIMAQAITEDGTLLATNTTRPQVGESLALDTLGNRLWTTKDGGDYHFFEKDKKGNNWCWKYKGGARGLHFFTIDEKTGEASPGFIVPGTENMTFGGSISETFYAPDADLFWCKSSALLFAFHPARGVVFNFSKDYAEIVKSNITKIYFDNRQNTWLTTSNGIYKIQLKLNPFKTYFNLPAEDVVINKSFSARGILVDGDYLWAVSNHQHRKYRLNMQTNELLDLGFMVKNDKMARGQLWTFPVNTVYPLNEEELILGINDGMAVLNKHNLAYKIIEPHPFIQIRRAWSTFKDRKDNFWMGLETRALVYWDREKDTLFKYMQYNDFELFKQSTIYSFLELDKQQILLGSNRGIFLFHLEQGIKDRFWAKGEGANYFPHNVVYHLVKDSEEENVYWAATGGGGLIRWTETDNQQLTTDNRQFTIEDGLSSNVIYAVYEDDFGNLWLPSEEGLMRFNKHTYQSIAFTTEDGITHNEFNRISHYRHEDGTLYFGGLNGITSFHPKDLGGSEDLEDIPLQITSFQQFDGKLNKIVDKTAQLVQNNSIIIAPNDKFFSIDLALLEYSESTSIRYAYQIDTQSEDWIYLNDNHLRISGLPYGNHVLRIKGQASSSQFSKQELTIPILVKKPFYLQTWFIISMLLAISGSLIFWYKRRTEALRQRQAELEDAVNKATETIRKQNEELKNLDKVKSRFFANVSHELRTPITLILGPLTTILKSGALSQKNKSLADLGRKNAKNLLNLVNEILDLTKMESGKIVLKEEATEFYEFLKLITSAFDGLAQQKNIQYSFSYKAAKNIVLNIDTKKIEKLVNNLLSNAFKFTSPNGKIIFAVEDKQENVLLSVQDSGRGIHPDDLPHVFDRFYQSSQPNVPKEGGTGIGLSLCMEFAKLMNGKLWAESEVGKGSRFYFEFPKSVVSSQLLVESSQFKVQSSKSPDNPQPTNHNRQPTTDNRQLNQQKSSS